MRVVAVLTGLALAAPLAATGGHARAIEIADTMESALGKMVSGVEQFLAEAKDAKTTRAARKFAGEEVLITEEDLNRAEEKGEHLAGQMVRNLHALAGAAKALQQAARDAPQPAAPKEVAMSEGKKDGYVMSLENKVSGQRKAIEELEDEKKSLVESVANLMHRGADPDLKQQLADARAEVVRLEQQAKQQQAEQQGKASQQAAQLESANQLLTEKLQECQSSTRSTEVEQQAVTTEVKCKTELSQTMEKLAKAEGEHDSLVQTVQTLLQGSDQLKAELQAKQNCTVQVAAAAPAKPQGFDVAHMADTVKIDQYIATAGHPTAGANVTDLAPIKPVHFQASSVKAASEALAGRGDIGKYLRGAKDDNAESKSGAQAALAAADAVDVDQQIDALMPEDVDVLKAADAVGAKKVRKAHSDDNLAQKLLLQAEQTLKLAA